MHTVPKYMGHMRIWPNQQPTRVFTAELRHGGPDWTYAYSRPVYRRFGSYKRLCGSIRLTQMKYKVSTVCLARISVFMLLFIACGHWALGPDLHDTSCKGHSHTTR